jgi:hypothetical protein
MSNENAWTRLSKKKQDKLTDLWDEMMADARKKEGLKPQAESQDFFK